MNKIALTAAVLAFPAVTFAGGYGNADLMNFIKNFDPSTRAERVQPVVGAIGSETDLGASSLLQTSGNVSAPTTSGPTTNRAFAPRSTGPAGTLSSEATFNRLNYGSDYDLLSEREREARRKLIRLRSIGY